jgi:hypothetical protein
MFQAGFDDRHKLFLLAASVIIATSGCAGSGNSSSGTPLPGTSEPGQAIVLEQQTSTVLTTADSDQTGWDLLWQSQTLSGAQAQSPLLASAERFLDHGHSEIATSVLQLVQQPTLNHSQVFDLDLLQSRVALQSGHPHTALAVLDRHKNQTMKPAQQAEGLFFETVAYLQLEEFARALESARQLEILVIRHDLDSVYPMFLHHLKSMPTAELGHLARDTTTPTMAGWAELALLIVEHGWNTYGLARALGRWQRVHVNHPANRYIPARLMADQTPAGPAPRQLALLLPLSSVYADAAKAVRDGFLSMRQIDTNPTAPEVRIYDFGDRTELVRAYYQRAIDDGAEMVIGPLGKNAIAALSELDTLPVPTLVLGTAEGLPADQALGFSLSPEDEAFAVVRRAYRAGFRRAAILYPDSVWGRRMIQAATRHWKKMGGTIVAQGPYFESASDHSRVLKRLLDIDHSLARGNALQDTIGRETRIRFIPRRRQDLDVLLMFAGPAQARLLKPQIDYLQAHDLPVYSSSRIFSGRPDPVGNLDLQGVIFGDIPWLLVNTGRYANSNTFALQREPYRQTPLDRLFALGIDAYSLVHMINRLRGNLDQSHHGATGVIRIDESGRVLRAISWATFEDGKVTLLPRAAISGDD